MFGELRENGKFSAAIRVRKGYPWKSADCPWFPKDRGRSIDSTGDPFSELAAAKTSSNFGGDFGTSDEGRKLHEIGQYLSETRPRKGFAMYIGRLSAIFSPKIADSRPIPLASPFGS